MPLPRDRESMLQFLSSTRAAMEAAEARLAPAGEGERAGARGGGQLEPGVAVQPQPPPRPPTGLQAPLLALGCAQLLPVDCYSTTAERLQPAYAGLRMAWAACRSSHRQEVGVPHAENFGVMLLCLRACHQCCSK